MRSTSPPPEAVPGLVLVDPTLAPYAAFLREREQRYAAALARFAARGGLLGEISRGHHYFGLNRGERNGEPGVWYREWAPGAYRLALVGDFNGWNHDADPLERDAAGVWNRFFPDREYAVRLVHGSRVKVHVSSADGEEDRIPAYVRRVVQEGESGGWSGQYWCPPEPYRFQHPSPPLRHGLKIYEAHVGMAQEEPRVGTYSEFASTVLPRAAALGYNAVQLMAIAEHPYYGSFGYHVSSFFAPSSRFGTPEELKALIDAAHGMGLFMLMDLVHSHAVKNTLEGLNRFDGTDDLYFHPGPRGEHPAWDSRLFDYGRYEVQRFLLSNVRYWLEEFRFDGFRFDGVTSMIYRDHGLGAAFDSYEPYFSDNVDPDAVTYLSLATEVAHAVRPGAITIAEDVSGMPGLARPVREGGLGFDYRLAMGVPDYWIRLLKEKRDEDWDVAELYPVLLNRRWSEKHVGYAESHDQALVGDQTLLFRMLGEAMYWRMDRASQSPVVDRGLALHKLIRLLTFSLAGEGYLCFMGNEWGHPEWIDFPREGNGWSHAHARRLWSLADDPNLRYRGLGAFDRDMLALDTRYDLLNDRLIELLWTDPARRVLVYRHGPLVFAVNLHPTESYPDLPIPVPDRTDYRLVLDTDRQEYEGFGRVTADARYVWQDAPVSGREQHVLVYLPNRTALVLAPE